MKSKLAGRLSLQDMISAQLETAREKLAASEPESEKIKKLVEHEKSYHGHVPSVKEEKEEDKKERKAGAKAERAKEEAEEKKASAEDVEKLASALDYVGEMFKEADAIENGGEYAGGGEQLPTASPVAGKQPDKKDAAKRWAVLLSTPPEKPSDSPAATAMMTNEGKVPGGAAYPAKGVLKTAFATSTTGHKMDAAYYNADAEAAHKKGLAAREYGDKKPGTVGLATAADVLVVPGLGGKTSLLRRLGDKITERHMDYAAKKHEKGDNAYNPFGGLLTKSRYETGEKKVKQSSASVDYILNKIAEYKGGGETLDNQAAPVPANAGRELIQSNQALIDYTKRQAKSPRKAELAQVLVEPAMTAATDSKVNENLRNAPQAGVKIAAAKALLQKIAEEGCSCDGKKECRYCKMQAVLEKKKEEKAEQK